mgnify:CR=1 FL=1
MTARPPAGPMWLTTAPPDHALGARCLEAMAAAMLWTAEEMLRIDSACSGRGLVGAEL